MNLKKIWFLGILILFIPCLTLFSLDLSRYGYSIIRTYEEQKQIVYVVQDRAGNNFEFIGESMSDSQANLLVQLRKQFADLKYIKIKTLRVVIADGEVEALILPYSFTYKGEDLTKYLPSGIQFYYEYYLEYDFRMLIKKLFIRIKGQYFDETSLADQMIEAVKDPVAYIRSHEPEYLIKKIAELDAQMNNMYAEGSKAVENLGKRTASLESRASELKNVLASLRAEQEDLREQHSEDINSLKQEFSEEMEERSGEISELDENISSLAKELASLKQSTVMVSSQGLFSSLKEIDPEVIRRVVEVKETDLSLTPDVVSKQLKGEGIKVSKNQVTIIFTIYFPELEE